MLRACVTSMNGAPVTETGDDVLWTGGEPSELAEMTSRPVMGRQVTESSRHGNRPVSRGSCEASGRASGVDHRRSCPQHTDDRHEFALRGWRGFAWCGHSIVDHVSDRVPTSKPDPIYLGLDSVMNLEHTANSGNSRCLAQAQKANPELTGSNAKCVSTIHGASLRDEDIVRSRQECREVTETITRPATGRQVTDTKACKREGLRSARWQLRNDLAPRSSHGLARRQHDHAAFRASNSHTTRGPARVHRLPRSVNYAPHRSNLMVNTGQIRWNPDARSAMMRKGNTEPRPSNRHGVTTRGFASLVDESIVWPRWEQRELAEMTSRHGIPVVSKQPSNMGFSCFESTNARIFASSGATGADVYAAVAIARDAYGVTEIDNDALLTERLVGNY